MTLDPVALMVAGIAGGIAIFLVLWDRIKRQLVMSELLLIETGARRYIVFSVTNSSDRTFEIKDFGYQLPQQRRHSCCPGEEAFRILGKGDYHIFHIDVAEIKALAGDRFGNIQKVYVAYGRNGFCTQKFPRIIKDQLQ